MITRRGFMTAIRALALGLVVLAITPAADAALRLTIIEYTDATFSTSKGGYQVVSAVNDPNDAIAFLMNGSPSASGGTLTTIQGAGGVNPNFSGMEISSRITSRQFPDFAELVDHEVDARHTGTAARFFEVIVTQDLYTLPDTDPLIFAVSLNTVGTLNAQGQPTANSATRNASAQYRATLITEEGPPQVSGTLPSTGWLDSVIGQQVEAGPILVANPSTGYTLVSTMRLSFGQGNPSRINVTGSATVAPIPEPGTLAIALAGLPLLGLGAWVRRRKARA